MTGAGVASEVAEFALPDLGEGLTDAVVVRWLVEVGDRIDVDQPIVEVESAKAVVEIPSPYAGLVESRHGEEGDVLPVGATLVRVRERPAAAGVGVGVGVGVGETIMPALVGFGPAARAAGPAAAGARHTAGTRRTLDASRTADAAQTAGAGPFVGRVRDRAPKVISPVVRRLARDAGLDLAAVVAAGADGVIRRADVERLLAASATSATGGTGGPGGHATGGTGAHGTRTNGAAPAGDAVHAPTVRRVPLASRRAVVERMVRSRREIPEATAWRDVDVTDLLAARAQINAASPDHPVTVLGLLARVCVAGLARFPELNATIDGERAEILQYSSVDLGVAVAGARSLVVPVVRNAGELAAPGLSARIRELTARAGAGTLTPAELSGGTFTLNNHGALGSDGAVPIINHPQVAQLAVGRIAQRPWVVGGEIRPRHVAQLTVVFDHRACDGAPVGGFLSFLARCVEQPLLLIAEL